MCLFACVCPCVCVPMLVCICKPLHVNPEDNLECCCSYSGHLFLVLVAAVAAVSDRPGVHCLGWDHRSPPLGSSLRSVRHWRQNASLGFRHLHSTHKSTSSFKPFSLPSTVVGIHLANSLPGTSPLWCGLRYSMCRCKTCGFSVALESGTRCVDHAGLKLTEILLSLPLSPECLD